jgi:hypothetical protein
MIRSSFNAARAVSFLCWISRCIATPAAGPYKVHVVPHTHGKGDMYAELAAQKITGARARSCGVCCSVDDVGWQRTPEGYFQACGISVLHTPQVAAA